MIQHPILFSGPMVRAILEGRKTQTRRVINPQFSKLWGFGVRQGDDRFSAHVDIEVPDGWKWILCPYGQPGDLLWVRETWNYFGGNEYLYQQDKGSVSYRADSPVTQVHGDRWRPSIHMPRWASRLMLSITDVRVQRVQEITEKDAEAEGMRGIGHSFYGEFRLTWDSINAKRGYSWVSNPYVWALTFEVANG